MPALQCVGARALTKPGRDAGSGLPRTCFPTLRNNQRWGAGSFCLSGAGRAHPTCCRAVPKHPKGTLPRGSARTGTRKKILGVFPHKLAPHKLSTQAVRGVREEAARYNPAPCAPSHTPAPGTRCLPRVAPASWKTDPAWASLGVGQHSARARDGRTRAAGGRAEGGGLSLGGSCPLLPRARVSSCRRPALPSGSADRERRRHEPQLQRWAAVPGQDRQELLADQEGLRAEHACAWDGAWVPGVGVGKGRGVGLGAARAADGSPRRWRAFSTWTTRWRSWCSRSCAMPAAAEVGPAGSGPPDPGGDTESVGLEKTSKIIEFSLWPSTTVPTRLWHWVLRPSFTWTLPGRWPRCLPRQPIPTCNHPFRENIPPNVQAQPLPAQLNADLLSYVPARPSASRRVQRGRPGAGCGEAANGSALSRRARRSGREQRGRSAAAVAGCASTTAARSVPWLPHSQFAGWYCLRVFAVGLECSAGS